MAFSRRERRDINPAPLLPALQGAFHKLDALGALDERIPIGGILDDMSDEHLPLDLEAVVVDLVIRDLLPAAAKIDGLPLVRIPDRPRRRLARLDHAIGEPGNRGPVRAIDLERDEVVAVDA